MRRQRSEPGARPAGSEVSASGEVRDALPGTGWLGFGLQGKMARGVLLLWVGACATRTTAPPARDPLVELQRTAEASGGARQFPVDSKLVDSVVLLGSSPDALAPAAVSRAMRELSRALRPLAAEAASSVRHAGERLEAAAPSSLSHAGLIKEGLQSLLTAMLRLPAPAGRSDEYRQALQALTHALKGIRPVAPLSEQRAAVGASFRAATDAVLLSHGREAPFRVPSAPSPREPLPVELELEHARLRVLELARARWTNGREGASLALRALADVMVAADQKGTVSEQTSELRFEAGRVGDTTSSGLGVAASAKRGLTLALDGLERILGRAEEESSSFSRAARQAVASIDERSSIGLQRGPVQDAFRATVDAFAVELSPRCPLLPQCP